MMKVPVVMVMKSSAPNNEFSFSPNNTFIDVSPLCMSIMLVRAHPTVEPMKKNDFGMTDFTGIY